MDLPGGPPLKMGERPDGSVIEVTETGSRGERVTVMEARDRVNDELGQTLLIIFAVALLAVGAAVLLAVRQANRLTAPLTDLAETAERLGSGDPRPRHKRYGVTELDRVADVLDASAERIARMLTAERRLAADASHQLRTPLTALSMRIEEISVTDDPETVKEEASIALTQVERLTDVVERLDAHLAKSEEGHAGSLVAPMHSNTSADEYRDKVLRAKEYIAAGDIFQVVLSQRLALPFKLPPFALYRALRRLNPSPFLFFIDLGGFAIVGSSPEILVRLRDGTVTIRPIAGTRPRGGTPAEDRALAEDLLSDPKELAEHLMLLDLGRNDVGRVAAADSVEVTASFTIERYSHVMHIVSNVVGRLDPAKDALDALFAGFPAGTVSGAPKVRACQIIAELEPETRGPYAGGVGYFAPDGSVDSCIVLRTA
ncbi:MAG: chorismate-binding protein, partial [Actinomycetes bacterium]